MVRRTAGGRRPKKNSASPSVVVDAARSANGGDGMVRDGTGDGLFGAATGPVRTARRRRSDATAEPRAGGGFTPPYIVTDGVVQHRKDDTTANASAVPVVVRKYSE